MLVDEVGELVVVDFSARAGTAAVPSSPARLFRLALNKLDLIGTPVGVETLATLELVLLLFSIL